MDQCNDFFKFRGISSVEMVQEPAVNVKDRGQAALRIKDRDYQF